jgi:hypothetical protein
MAIPDVHKNRCIYHFTHLDNLRGLLKTGFLAKNDPAFPTQVRSIAHEGIQNRRSTMSVPCGPMGVVHEYVPLYFGSLSPMLLGVINKKNVDQALIMYFEFPISILDRPDVVFTDASANTVTPPNFFDDPSDLDKLNWDEIDSLRWGTDDGRRNERMAEVLVHRRLALTEAKRIAVWNDHVKKEIQKIQREIGGDLPAIDPNPDSGRRHWFLDFSDPNRKLQSIVTGPIFLGLNSNQAITDIVAGSGDPDNAPYKNLAELLMALKADFACLTHTSELVGLESDNAIHKETVDVHTKEVVECLRNLPELKALDDRDKVVVELAAFLHDIGKGPKSRWEENGGKQKVDLDHPARAIPMILDICQNLVRDYDQQQIERLVKLVSHHDLIGDVIGRGRDEEQIYDVATDETLLDMLIMLGKADVLVLNPRWWDEDKSEEIRTRCLVKIKKRVLEETE